MLPGLLNPEDESSTLVCTSQRSVASDDLNLHYYCPKNLLVLDVTYLKLIVNGRIYTVPTMKRHLLNSSVEYSSLTNSLLSDH